MDKPPRFDDWNDVVDCNQCARYWDSSCDGVSKGSKRLCTSFVATRSVVIPEQLKSQQRAIKRLSWAVILLSVAGLVQYLTIIFGG